MQSAAFDFALNAKTEITTSPFELFDLSLTARNIAINYKIPYNDKQGRKDRFRSGETACAKVLAYLAMLELESLRQTNPKAYKMFLREKSLNFSVWTNRGQLRTMLDNEYTSLDTLSRFVRILTKAGVVTRKDNSNRALGANNEKVIDARGRGNFRLWISRSVFVEKSLIGVENAPKVVKLAPVSPKTQTAENQPFTNPKTENSELSLTLKDKNIKIHTNNGLKGTSYQLSTILSDSGLYETKTKEDKRPQIENQVPKAEIGDLREKENEQYFKKIELDRKVAQAVPTKEIDKASYLILYSIFANIFPKYNQITVDSVKIEANWLIRQLLLKIMDSFDVNVNEAFKIALRGLYLAQKHQEKNPDFEFYEILTWLNTTYSKGTLWFVIDKWVRQERERMSMSSKKRQERIRWQTARAKIDAMVAETLQTLSKGLSNTSQVMEFNKRRLKMTLGKLKISEDKKEIYLNEYSERLMNSMHLFKTKVVYESQDSFKRDFSNYLLQVASNAKK